MTHSPPVPPGNQSPYPIVEPPHVHEPVPDGPPETGNARSRDTVQPALIAGAAVVGIAAVAAVATAVVRGRRKKVTTKSSARQPVRNEAKRTATAKSKPSPVKRSATPKSAASTAKASAPTPKSKRRASGDDPAKRGPRDASRIAMGEAHEVRYWTARFGVDREALQRAIDSVGNGAEAVEAELGRT